MRVTFHSAPFGSRCRSPVFPVGSQGWLGHRRFMWFRLYWSRITNGSVDVLTEVNCRLRDGHVSDRQGVRGEKLGAEEKVLKVEC
jgi:hypothetical protein